MGNTSHTESLLNYLLGDPSLVPPAFADVLDAMTYDQADRVVDELTPKQMAILETIGTLVALRKVATNQQTFTEWLGTAEGKLLAPLMRALVEEDPDWPLAAHTYAELRDYVYRKHSASMEMLEHAWIEYRKSVIAPHGTTGNIRTETHYATRIVWADGTDETKQNQMDATSRFEAQRYVERYNAGPLEALSFRSSAAVVRRSVVYGPWFMI